MGTPAAIALLIILLLILPSAAIATHDDHLRDEWPTFRGDAARTGVRGHSDGPGTGEVLWRFRMNDFAGPSPPAYAQGLIFFGGRGEFYALEHKTGHLVWSFTGEGRFLASPVVSNGTVYASTLAGYVYALDATTGRELWHQKFDDEIWYSPLIMNGTLYVGAGRAGLHSLDAATGEAKWTYQLRGQIMGDLAAAENAIQVATRGDGSWDSHVRAVDAHGPDILWSRPMPRVGGKAPTLDGANVIWIGRGIHALEAKSGELLWELSTEMFTARAPVVSGSELYAIFHDQLHILSPAFGTTVATRDIVPFYTVTPTIHGDTIYLGTSNGSIMATSRDTGEEFWRNKIAAHMLASPALIDGILYVNPSDIELVAIDAGAGLQHQREDEMNPSWETSAQGLLSMIVTICIAVEWRRRSRTCR